MPTPFTRDQLSPAMQERYGLTGRPVGRRIAVAALVLGFLGVLVFVAFGVTRNPVESRLVAWDAADDHVDITISVSRPPTTPVTCVLRAQDEKRFDLGYATVEIPPGNGDVVLDYALRTLAPAFSVELLGCAVDGPPSVSPPQFPPGVVAPDQPWTVSADG